MPEETTPPLFRLFNEINIIGQLSRSLLEHELPEGVLASHFSVLNHLVRVRDGQTPLALARAFQVPKTTMTHTLAGLDKHGFIDMRANPQDGRSKTIWITPAGRALRDRAIADVSRQLEPMRDDLDLDALLAMVPRLARLREWLDAHRKP